MITPLERSDGNILGFTLSDTLHDDDDRHFVPAVDAAVAAHGKVRLLAHFVDFHGWDLPALWDDIVFAAKHRSQVERIALVGERRWEAGMAAACKPFTSARVRYFDAPQIDDAWAWIEAVG